VQTGEDFTFAIRWHMSKAFCGERVSFVRRTRTACGSVVWSPRLGVFKSELARATGLVRRRVSSLSGGRRGLGLGRWRSQRRVHDYPQKGIDGWRMLAFQTPAIESTLQKPDVRKRCPMSPNECYCVPGLNTPMGEGEDSHHAAARTAINRNVTSPEWVVGGKKCFLNPKPFTLSDSNQVKLLFQPKLHLAPIN